MAKTEPFERHTAQYKQWFKINKYAYKSEILAIKTLMPESGEGLEIGIGSGLFAKPLGIKYGIDPSEKMRAIAQKRGIKALGGVAESLPYGDSRFDFALMITTICFLDDVEAALKEAYRVVKPKGSLIIGFVDKESSLGKLYLQHKNESVFYGVATFYSVDKVIFYLKKVGFKSYTFNQTIFHPLNKIKTVEPVKKGYGEGSFVVVKAVK